MNIYLITQNENDGWDTYNAAVVVARNEEKAKDICPAETGWGTTMWATCPHKVKATLIGIANKDQQNGKVICVSFKAG